MLVLGLNELIEQICRILHPFENFGSTVIFLLIIAGTIIEITPIKINPWGSLLRWAGENFNSGINKRIDKLEEQINEHIEDTNKSTVKKLR